MVAMPITLVPVYTLAGASEATPKPVFKLRTFSMSVSRRDWSFGGT